MELRQEFLLIIEILGKAIKILEMAVQLNPRDSDYIIEKFNLIINGRYYSYQK